MQRQDVRDQLTTNLDVFGSDGDKVGTIVAVDPASIVVEKGFFFPTDYSIPLTAISRIDADGVILAVTKDEALHQHWDAAPTAATGDVASTSTIPPAEWPETTATAPVGTTDLVDDQDTVVVPVAEEELTATKRPVERGAVRVEKDVVAEERTLDVPVTEERVHVARRAVDRPVTDADHVFEEGVIEVPVRGEQVELQKRVRVAEEVELTKDAVQRTEQVRGTVRREEVRVADATPGGEVVVDAPGAATIVPSEASGAGLTATTVPSAVNPGLAWPPTTDADYDALVGKEVASADDQKIGTIRVVQHPAVERPGAGGRHVLLLEPGLFNDWFAGFDPIFLPETAIASVEPDRIVLNLTAEQIQQRSQTWTQPPAGFDGSVLTSLDQSTDAAGTTS